jgi:hypothetical protein
LRLFDDNERRAADARPGPIWPARGDSCLYPLSLYRNLTIRLLRVLVRGGGFGRGGRTSGSPLTADASPRCGETAGWCPAALPGCPRARCCRPTTHPRGPTRRDSTGRGSLEFTFLPLHRSDRVGETKSPRKAAGHRLAQKARRFAIAGAFHCTSVHNAGAA